MIEIPGYRVLAPLGRGGMASVYLAEQLSLHRQVALKVLAPQLASDPSFVERFLREGRVAAQLRHRHIVAIHDVGVHHGVAYMALDYLPGGSLASQETLAPREALRVLREIGSALDLAHRAGVVHRDIKPENILIDEDGRHVLSDFGIARIAHASQAMTREGTTVGTPAYMAPEQWRAEAVDGRADLYSLGVVLFQLLTGRVPYNGTDGWAIGMQHMQAPLPQLPETLRALQPLLDRLLAKEPAARPASGAALVQAIDALLASPALPSPADSIPPAPPLAVTTPPWRAQPQQAAELFATPAEPAARPWWRRYGVAAGGLTLALAAAFGWRGSSSQAWPLAGDSLATVAVLPCVSYANLTEHRELGDSLAAELIHRLGRLRALTVIARSSSFPLRDAPLTAREIGERLGATHLVSCSIRRAPDGLRIGAELVDIASGAQRWSAEYDRSGDDPMQVVDELAVGLSERLLEQLAGPERAQLIRHGSRSPEAVRAVAQARELARQQTPEAVKSAREAATAALRLDPDYADAYVALAELDLTDARTGGRASEIVRAEVQARLQSALEIDPEFAPALALRSRLQCEAWEWTGCGRDSARALELEPGSGRVQAAAVAFHLAAGSRGRAVDHATRALRIDPESAANWRLLALAYLHAGRTEDALALAQRAALRFPELWAMHDTHALVLQQLGRCGAALAPLQRALALAPGDPGLQAREAALQACDGRRERAVALLRELELRRAAGEPVGDHALALCHLALGQTAQALDALEAMQAARDPQLVEWIRRPLAGLELLADEPRWTGLIAALNLPTDEANRSGR